MVDVARKRIHELLGKIGSLIEAGLPIELVDSVDALCLHLLSRSRSEMIQLSVGDSQDLISRLQKLLQKGAGGEAKAIIEDILVDLQD
ncbi:MAG: hypothetical protein ACTSW4_08100 [Candidatus Ranarchaeia archaeon]